MSLEEMDKSGTAGVVLGLVGGLLALVPELEQLLALRAGWQEPLVMALVAIGALTSLAAVVYRDHVASGSLVMGALGIVIAVLGPTAPGLLIVIGGLLLYASVQSPGPAPYDKEASTPRRSG